MTYEIKNEMLSFEQLNEVSGGKILGIGEACQVISALLDEIDSEEYSMLSDRYKGAVISRIFLQNGVGGALSTLSKVPGIGDKLGDLSNKILNCGEHMSPGVRKDVETVIRTVNKVLKKIGG